MALYNLETVTTAVIQNSLVNNRLDATPEWNDLMTRLAETSRIHYRKLVHENPNLLTFFKRSLQSRKLVNYKYQVDPQEEKKAQRIYQV